MTHKFRALVYRHENFLRQSQPRATKWWVIDAEGQVFGRVAVVHFGALQKVSNGVTFVLHMLNMALRRGTTWATVGSLAYRQ